jgi:hypothetical protein
VGGLVAGLFIFCADYVLHGVLLGADWKAAMSALGRPEPGSAEQMHSMLMFFAQALVAGVACSWLYAAIRPRFGAGPGTALRAGLWGWVMLSLSGGIVAHAIGLYPLRLVVVPLAGDLVIYSIAAQIAGALYQEAA